MGGDLEEIGRWEEVSLARHGKPLQSSRGLAGSGTPTAAQTESTKPLDVDHASARARVKRNNSPARPPLDKSPPVGDPTFPTCVAVQPTRQSLGPKKKTRLTAHCLLFGTFRWDGLGAPSSQRSFQNIIGTC